MWSIYLYLRIYLWHICCSIVPIFLQVHQRWRRLFLGQSNAHSFQTVYEMVHLKHVPHHYNHLAGLLDIFKGKIVRFLVKIGFKLKKGLGCGTDLWTAYFSVRQLLRYLEFLVHNIDFYSSPKILSDSQVSHTLSWWSKSISQMFSRLTILKLF